jgi:hypothetical protein
LEGEKKMEWQFIVMLIVMVPVVLLPVAFVWYLNLGGVWAAMRRARKEKAAEKQLASEKKAA